MPAFTTETRRFTFELAQTRYRNEIFLKEVADAGKLVVDEVDFLLFCLFLRAKSDDLFIRLVDAFLKLRFLAGPGGPAQIEKLVFCRKNLCYFWHVGLAQKFIGKFDGLRAISFGREPRFAGVELGQSLCNNRQIGARYRVIKAHQKIAGLNPIAVANQQFSDHAAGRVLDLFDV